MIAVVIAEIVLCIFIFVFSPFYVQFSPLFTTVNNAVAVIHPTQGNTINGIVTFKQEADGVRVIARIHNLKPGKHGFHLHAYGDCGCADAKCAGDHYNPTNQPHGGPTSIHRHVGDFGNIEANEQGEGLIEFIDTHISLNGRHSIIGRTVIIHADADDLVTQPSGNAGARIGCGVVGIGAEK